MTSETAAADATATVTRIMKLADEYGIACAETEKVRNNPDIPLHDPRVAEVIGNKGACRLALGMAVIDAVYGEKP
jgi:hypothetical protein